MRFNEDDVRKIQQMYCADVQDLHLGQQAVMPLSGAWLEQGRLILEHAQEALKKCRPATNQCASSSRQFIRHHQRI
ncbi:MAG TPA: hypothetical protein VFK46_07230 [Candidatus Macondimonas sp.]|nr:hypothetical protein [Candidatus Macondimonas sp.]